MCLFKSLTKTIVQNLYTMYTKIIQSTRFVCILYTKIVQIKILFVNEYTRNVTQILIYIKIYTQTAQNLYKGKLKRAWNLRCMFFVHTQMHKLYKMDTNLNWTMWLLIYIFCVYKNSTFFTFQVLALETTPSSILFSYSKKY